MNLELSVREWLALQGLLERTGLSESDDDMISIEALKARVRAVTGRALQALEKTEGPSTADRWLDNQRKKLDGIRPPPEPNRTLRGLGGRTDAHPRAFAPTQPASLADMAAAVSSVAVDVELEGMILPDPGPAGSYVDDAMLELYDDPTNSDVESPDLTAVWEVVKTWRVYVPGLRRHAGPASMCHAMAIIRSLRSRWDFDADSRRRS